MIENFSRSKLGLGLLQIIRYSKLGLDRYSKLGLPNYKVLKVRGKFFFEKIFKGKKIFKVRVKKFSKKFSMGKKFHTQS